jgi:hydrogenase expression/formation protein HypE
MRETSQPIPLLPPYPLAGKISTPAFERIIATRLGAVRPDVLVGPRHGVDAGIVDIGGDRVMAVTTDPFFVMPEYGWERAAWFAVHIVASDAATSGLPPAYCTVDLNLPPALSDGDLADLWTAVHDACRDIDLAVVSGHTGRYDGCAFPMVGGATVISVGPRDSYVTPAMSAPGDVVIVTKGAAIETTGTFGVTFPDRLSQLLGPDIARAAADLFWSMSVVRDARVAASVGVREHGVTAMHDATERGIWGGLVEIAQASGTGLIVHQDAVLLPDPVRALCGLLAIDPYSASSEGTLLLTCRPDHANEVISHLAAHGIPATAVGEVLPPEEGIHVVRSGRSEPLTAPESDPFWPAYEQALAEWRP